MNRARGLYVVLAVVALGLVTTANRLGARSLQTVAGSRILWLAEACVPSLLVCLVC